MDVERYRKRYEAELAKASRRPAGTTRELNKDGQAATAATAATASIADDVPRSETDFASGVSELLRTLRDRKQPVAARLAAVRELSALEFLGPHFEPFRAEYKEALREIATDPRSTLRQSALERLAMDKDPYAQDLLMRGLERPDDALVSEAKALQFLAYDDHAEIAPLARKVYRRATGSAREEALRVLATDPESEKLLKRLLTDKSEKSSIRRISASGLQSLNPEAFERTARRIVADDDDYDEIRATSLAALAHGRGAHEKPPDPKFVDRVQELTVTTSSTALRASSKRFLRSTDT